MSPVDNFAGSVMSIGAFVEPVGGEFRQAFQGLIDTLPNGVLAGFSTELVAGVLVGAALGWLADRLLGTSPWGMIVLLLLGFAAGVLNVMRAAGVMPSNSLAPPESK